MSEVTWLVQSIALWFILICPNLLLRATGALHAFPPAAPPCSHPVIAPSHFTSHQPEPPLHSSLVLCNQWTVQTLPLASPTSHQFRSALLRPYFTLKPHDPRPIKCKLCENINVCSVGVRHPASSGLQLFFLSFIWFYIIEMLLHS